jgi:ankyrin repeat protein
MQPTNDTLGHHLYGLHSTVLWRSSSSFWNGMTLMLMLGTRMVERHSMWQPSDGTKLLLKRDDIDVNRYDKFGDIPLHGCLGKKVGTLKLLLERDDLDVNRIASIDDTALIHAVRNGSEDSVRLLLEREDVDVNVKERFHGRTPLILAASSGSERMVRMLLEKDGVDVSAVNKQGQTAMSCAIAEGHEGVARLLLEHERGGGNGDMSRGHSTQLLGPVPL